MGDSANRAGGAYALTVFTAILPGETETVRAVIENLPRGESSPLARMPQLHLSRLMIFDHLVHQGPSQRPDKLANDYLVFTAVCDGALDPFLRDLATRVPEADTWWRHCVAYPGLGDVAAFTRWIRHNQIDSSLFAVAAPGATVTDVLSSLELRERVVGFALETQGMNAEQLQQRFLATFVGDA